MKVIPISGVIGWDVSAKDIRSALEAAAGDEVEVQISSPGGFVYDMLEIYNLIRNYQGKKSTRLMGIAASAASYVAMAAGFVRQEDNAVFMIHNAQGGALGDQNTMRKAAEILDGFSGLIARAYAEKSGKSIEAVRTLMDSDAWYFGIEALDAGFVDEVVTSSTGAGTDRAAALAMARAQYERCKKIIGDVETAESLQQAAALLPITKEKPAGVAGVQTAAKADGTLKTGGAKTMTLEEFKRDNPALYAEATADARQAGKVEGVTEERARVSALEKWIAADAGNAKVAAIVAEAKATGKSEADVAPQLQVAVRDAKVVDPDNPPAVATTPAASGAGFDSEALAIIEKAGLTPDEVAKKGKGK